jgi:SAM-dependent methyltransferase
MAMKKNRKDPVFDLERAYADCHRIALRLAAAEAPGRALDLGAGQGALSYALRLRGFEVTAADINPGQFRAEGVACARLDLNRPLPFPDRDFDLVLAVEILEHLESPRAFLREVSRVLRPGGLAVVSTPNITSLPSRVLFLATGCFDLFVPTKRRLQDPLDAEADGHITPIPGWLLRYHLREGGFEIEKTRYTMAYIPLVPRAALRFLHGRLSGRVGLYAARRPTGS